MNNLDHYKFYFELPLYSKIKIDSQNDSDLISLISFRGVIDAYNPTLKENSTYTVNPCRRNNPEHFHKYGGMDYCELTCVRTAEKVYVFIYYDLENSEIQKIGQYQSIADFHISQIKDYDKVLSKEKLKEFTRAIGLAANGVGIGSFVYLRRIFESLIEEAHIKVKPVRGWDEENYQRQRMNEKIELLKDQLPEFLVENKSLYSILSVGVHSLTEQDCLAHYETVKLGIELILDEKLETYKKQKKIEEAKNKITSLTGIIKKN